MSARSEDNDVFESGGLEYLVDRKTGERVAASEGYQRLLQEADRDLPPWLPTRARRAIRLFKGPKRVSHVLAETRRNWIASYRTLLAGITAPTCLLWFSQRTPRVHQGHRTRWWWQRYDNVNAMFGEYPQLVNPAMVRAVRPLARRYVACTSRRGVPQRLVSRFTGRPITIDYAKDRPDLAERSATNRYYPSPEMHEDAATALEDVCRALLRTSSS